MLAVLVLCTGAAAPAIASAEPAGDWTDVERPNAPGLYGQDFLTGVWSDGHVVWAVGATSEDDSPEPQSLPWGVRCSPGSCELLDLAPVTDPLYTTVATTDIHGTAPDDVWAVGYAKPLAGEGLLTFPLIQHFDGSAWTLVDTSGLPSSFLESVAAVAPDDVWAMGCSRPCGGDSAVVLLHWDGIAWTDVSDELPEAYRHGSSYDQGDLLADGDRLFLPLGGDLLVREHDAWTVALDRHANVRAAGMVGDRVWAVGRHDVPGQSTARAAAWRERDSGWRRLPSPGRFSGSLTTVTGPDRRHVWVGGSTHQTGNTASWVLRRFDGAAWSIIPAPEHPPEDGVWYSLEDATTGPGGHPFTVGYFGDACDCGTSDVLRRGPSPD